MDNIENNLGEDFRFFLPVEIEKGKDKDGKETGDMYIKGVASTMDVDSDGEILDPNGFDLSYFLKKGHINWNHQTKDNPLAIIGEPVEGVIKDNKFIIKAKLYKDSDLACKVFQLAKIMEKAGGDRRLGFSIEGKVKKRDEVNKKFVKKAAITNVAVAPTPKNASTFVDIVKGMTNGLDSSYDLDESGNILNVMDGTEVMVVKGDMSIHTPADEVSEFEKAVVTIATGHALGYISDDEMAEIRKGLEGISIDPDVLSTMDEK